MRMPNQMELMQPTVDALHELGGSGSIHEINEVVIKQMELPDEVAQELQGRGPQTKLAHRLGWARTRLKHAGLVDNSLRGIWNLTLQGLQLDPSDRTGVVRIYGEYQRSKRRLTPDEPTSPNGEYDEEYSDTSGAEDWRGRLLGVVQAIPPDAFERLCQRLLRESGFTEVRVIGKSGDGGIDVQGKVRFHGLISFPIMVQCKRLRGSVVPSMVRDFRGAMTGRADRGLLITTGNFTRDAAKEAARTVNPAIDLVDGNQLVEKLKELELGVSTQEHVVIDEDWFKSI